LTFVVFHGNQQIKVNAQAPEMIGFAQVIKAKVTLKDRKVKRTGLVNGFALHE
jgi:hypothetical protein